MKIKRTILAPIVVAAVALATGGWFLQRGGGTERTVYDNAHLFEQVLNYVSEGFVEKKEPSELYHMAIDGMLTELGDPHTSLMPAEDYENLRIHTQGEYGGLGISIAKRAGWITVISPLPGTPGERAGLRAGDQIIEVEGVSTKGWSEDEAVAKLRGPKGAPVNIEVARLGVEQPIPFSIVRDEIHIKSVPTAYMLTKDVGYLNLIVFSESSTDEVRDAINKLREQGARGIVLDVRQNSGGLLEQGVGVSDLFLKGGQAIVETRGRLPHQTHAVSAEQGDEFEGLPIVMLVGPGSASATEIVAGALQDHDRALIVGRTTFGKGSVQTVFKLDAKNWLKMTTARWYTPSGRSIQGPYGINHPTADSATPDSAEKTRPEYHTDDGRVVYGGGGIHPDLVIPPDTLTSDEQTLVKALSKNWAKFYEARFAFGVRYNKDHADLQPGFPVTPAMLDAFYQDLGKAGFEVGRDDYDAAHRWLEMQLGYEVTVSRWGVTEAQKRQNQDDHEVEVAIGLLDQATTPASLFSIAEDYTAAVDTASREPVRR